jgi:DNA-binding LytR/AlgR family response regulator
MNKPMRCLIVDSDLEARSDLLAHLGVHTEIQVLAAVKTVAEVIPLLSLIPDVIFLDASLAELNKLAALSAGLPTYFTVALARQEKGAFAASVPDASDVLLKPYTAQRISIAVTKLRLILGGGGCATG